MKNKIYYFSIGLIIGIILYIGGIKELLSFTLAIIFYGSIFYLFYFLFHKIKKSKKFLNYKQFLLDFSKKFSFGIIILILFLGYFAYYQNILYPAKMPQFTISNGDKVIVFQSMSHIGTKNFYEKIKSEIIKYKKQGFVYFYEGVKPGKKESLEAFNKAIGINFNKDTYKYFSKLYGVEHQDNSIFLGLVNNKDYNIDLDMDQIIELYNQKIKKLNKIQRKKQLPKQVININTQVEKSLASLNDKQLKILRFINKAFLNLMIKNNELQKIIMDNFANISLFNVILEERNKNLANAVLNSKDKKIFITYGLLHFNGVFKLLKQKDPNWKIVKIKYFYPIK